VDIVFANEEEAKAFTGKEPGEALDEFAGMARIAVVKTGSKGSLIKSGNEVFKIGIIKVTPVDTTGAGDLYASGSFMDNLLTFHSKKCGEMGAMLAGHVIEGIGSKMGRSMEEDR